MSDMERSERSEGRERAPRGNRNRRSRRRVCSFCADKMDYIDYKDVNRLRKYVTQRGKICPVVSPVTVPNTNGPLPKPLNGLGLLPCCRILLNNLKAGCS